jgi:hypothetical protein
VTTFLAVLAGMLFAAAALLIILVQLGCKDAPEGE